MKLIRHRIPLLVAEKGEIIRTRVAATPEEFRRLVAAKLVEEAEEFKAEPSREELADVYEVLATALFAYGWTIEEIGKMARAKAAERGSLYHAIVLLEDHET